MAVVDLCREITEHKRLETEKEVVNSINKILAFKECSTCDFYEQVKVQEGDELLPTFFLLEKLEGLEL